MGRQYLCAILGRVAAEKKPKLFEGGKDIMLSLGVVVVLMLLVVGGTGLCSVDSEKSDLAVNHEVDPKPFLEMEAQSTQTAIRIPHVPEGWYANSTRRSDLGGAPASMVGWVTADEGFVQSTQTDLPLDDAVAAYDEHYRPDEETQRIAGTDVHIFHADERNARDVWAADLNDARVLLSGSAKDDDFRALMEAFINAQPVS